ncbi:MAG: ABC transporter ATP-binding protein [Proteobacteria bacterium]|nr:ABC transporter ATP-binding protein [Pseudomonadota bacterium]MBU4276134.1 ABC transporter ATP-binding protein [Pseudomonadota bacterium]MBU4384755.1 ABC transporter ATP-binding protein [Pseudomonadota bacterium]MBU4606840.1 ABC transporter ATP-binding protein [Pseudomonadota bacterium]MCG2764065.1 ABC transporter ATP-binding protein [Desulfarculaceae bacterium]
MALIELIELRKSYRLGELVVPVLKGVSLQVEQGELVALMGASGSGKSTLMNILGCLDRPTSGQYWLDGREISQLSADQRAMLRNSKLGFVFQNFNLLPRTSALDNVAMPLSYGEANISEREARQRAQEMLALVGLQDRVHHEPNQLSGGQQQRVAIARSLVNRPQVLLADEPTGNLDSKTSEDILSLFQKLNQHGGITIILVTHDPMVARHARRTIHIHDGLVVEGAYAAEGNAACQEPAPEATL